MSFCKAKYSKSAEKFIKKNKAIGIIRLHDSQIAKIANAQCIVLHCIDIFFFFVIIKAVKGGWKMATKNITVRVDAELKQNAEKLFSDLGLNMSSAINMFLKNSVNYNGIPFEVRKLTPNAETKAALAEYGEMKNNPKKYKRYSSFDDALSEVFQDA